MVHRDPPVAFPTYAQGFPVVAALDSSCNLAPGGGVGCWGRNDSGQREQSPGPDYGNSVYTVLTKVVELSGGGQHFCARLQDGTVSCWGQNDVGQLGNGTDGNVNGTAGPVTGLTNATTIGLGWRHSCAVVAGTSGPGVVCWGANDAGQLGDGTMQEAKMPVPVTYLP